MLEEDHQSTLMTLRQRAGLTQKQLAEALGVTVTTVSAWERGAQVPRLTVIQTQQFLKVCQCTIDELVEAFMGTQKARN